MKIWLVLLLLPFTATAQLLQTPDTHWSQHRWEASWIAPTEEGTHFGVYHFRKAFTLASKPRHFVIHLSGDSRYRLYVNGNYVNEGPQLGDVRHRHYESLDIGQWLVSGNNVLAVQLTYYGEAAAVYMMGRRCGLIVQGDTKEEAIVNTGAGWKYLNSNSILPIVFKPGQREVSGQYYAAGPMDRLDGTRYPWNWEHPAYNDGSWKTPERVTSGAPFGAEGNGDEQWELIPRSIPLMERTYEPLEILRRVDNVEIRQPYLSFNVPANEKRTLLFDLGHLTTAYPEWIMSDGKGSEVKVTYAEALFNNINDKGHRDSIRGKAMNGVYDVFIPDGGVHRILTTTTWRAFRYVQFEITTGNQPLIIEKLGSWFTAYPFEKKAAYASSEPNQTKIFDIGWRTARLCAYDTYMDCPYWERLQYVGDTRIQALVSYYMTGDDRLARNAIEQFEWSLTYDGLTYSRYPSSLAQFIPNYSLVWVLMLHDFMMYRNDPAFVKKFLPSAKRVLEHFQQYIASDSMMTKEMYWDYMDNSWDTPPILEKSFSKKLSSNSLFYAYTLSRAAELFSFYNDNELATKYSALSYKLKQAVKSQCWDGASQLYADTPDKKHFSMHTNIMAVLCGLMPRDQQKDMLKRIMDNKGILQTTLYFDFYLGRAINQTGSGELYSELLKHWSDLVNQGLTTFPEGVSRSECHAWSASPDFEMLSTFAGIQPQLPGFKKVIIKPMLQKLDEVHGSIPHWAGTLSVDFVKKGKQLTGSVKLPPGVSGRLEWGDKIVELKSGETSIDVVSLLRTN